MSQSEKSFNVALKKATNDKDYKQRADGDYDVINKLTGEVSVIPATKTKEYFQEIV